MHASVLPEFYIYLWIKSDCQRSVCLHHVIHSGSPSRCLHSLSLGKMPWAFSGEPCSNTPVNLLHAPCKCARRTWFTLHDTLLFNAPQGKHSCLILTSQIIVSSTCLIHIQSSWRKKISTNHTLCLEFWGIIWGWRWGQLALILIRSWQMNQQLSLFFSRAPLRF